MAGARVVPVIINQPLEQLKQLLDNLNGLLLPGGGATLVRNDGSYTFIMQQACELINHIKKRNDEGTYYPIWATCLGFEILTLCIAEDSNILDNFESMPSEPAKLIFTPLTENSRIFTHDNGILTANTVISIFENEAVALQAHYHGFTTQSFE